MFINKSFIKLTVQTSLKLTCSNFHVSLQLNAGKLWRQKVGLSKLQTARGPLTDLPDFSFLDGRPTPLSVGQVRRKELQEKLAGEAVNGLSFLKRSQELLKKLESKQ